MPLYLPPNLAALAKVAGASPRLALHGLRVVDLGGAYRVEASDGRRLAVAQGQSTDRGYPPLDAVDEAPDHGPVLVPTDSWRAAFRLVDKHHPEVALAVGADGICFAGPSASQQLAPAEGPYPDVNTVLPTALPLVQVAVNAQLLAELLGVAAAFADAGNSHRTELLYFGPGKSLGVSTRNS